MKKILLLFAAALAILAGCSEFDDSNLQNRVDNLENRIEALEALCNQVNTNISSLQALVSALQNGDSIVQVAPILKNGKEIGYTITFAKGDPIIIYHSSDEGGSDGYGPVIGVKKASDGLYYWTLDGEWMLDAAGGKMLAQGIDGDSALDGKDGVTPMVKIDAGYWMVSYDNGASWERLAEAGDSGTPSDKFFKSIINADGTVIFTLTDGTEITIPKLADLSITFEETDAIAVGPYGRVNLKFKVSGNYDDIVVEAVASGGLKANVNLETKTSGTLDVEIGETVDEYCKVVVLVYDGIRTIMRTILFKEAKIEIVDSSEKTINEDGGELQLEYMSDVLLDVVIPKEATWIRLVSSKAMERHAVVLKVEKNTGKSRSAEIKLVSESGISLTYTVTQKAPRDMAEREALIELYESTGGDNWTNKGNWCSEEPIGSWYGVSVDGKGHVVEIRLDNNNLVGRIPESIGVFEDLKYLDLSSNTLYGKLPESIGDCRNLFSIRLNRNKLEGNLPESMSELSSINTIDLYDNSFKGTIPDWLYDLTTLEQLDLGTNLFNGTISEKLGNLTKLRILGLGYCRFEGPFPESIGKLRNLTNLNVEANYFTGPIPESIGNLTELGYLSFSMNYFTSIPDSIINLRKLVSFRAYEIQCSGEISDVIMNSDFGRNAWPSLLYKTGYTYSKPIPAPEFSHISTSDGLTLSDDIYAENKLTLISCLYRLDLSEVPGYINRIKEYYSKYHDLGFDVISYFSAALYDDILEYMKQEGIKWHMYDFHDEANDLDLMTPVTPLSCLVDSRGNVVHHSLLSDYLADDYDGMEAIFEEVFGDEIELYESTDYSQDGKVKTLQTASKGKGIDVVIMGDAFSDRLIADGTYDKYVNQAAEALFSEEPYKSFRDYFNVYQVNVVSKNDEYTGKSSTALETWFGSGTMVGGNDKKAFEYAQKAITEDAMDDALVIVMMNKNDYSGTCYMYAPSKGDYGDGASVSYFSANKNVNIFSELVLHEAGGHGFAKLADEYAYPENGAMPEAEKDDRRINMPYGWWKNADFTSDLNSVKWNRFIFDDRYENEGIGAYEGAFTFWSGAWRPTPNSIMRDNKDGFNAPSREAIYYRIHKLAYGEDWEYDYEEFVKYDAVNRAGTKSAAPDYVELPENFEPLAPPVVMGRSWNE